MDDGPEIAAFWAARLDDDERYWRVVTEAGRRRADAMTGKDMADMYGLMVDLLSDPQFREEAERWMDGDVMAPPSAERGLADIAADREILAALADAREFSGKTFASATPDGIAPGEVLGQRMRAATQVLTLEYVAKIRVARYSAHPGYLARWKP